jgi:hypothetical protein
VIADAVLWGYFEMKDQEIMELLNRKYWTIVCQRIKIFCCERGINSIKNVKIVCTSDWNFANRKHTAKYYKKIKYARNIGQAYKNSFLFICEI